MWQWRHQSLYLRPRIKIAHKTNWSTVSDQSEMKILNGLVTLRTSGRDVRAGSEPGLLQFWGGFNVCNSDYPHNIPVYRMALSS